MVVGPSVGVPAPSRARFLEEATTGDMLFVLVHVLLKVVSADDIGDGSCPYVPRRKQMFT